MPIKIAEPTEYEKAWDIYRRSRDYARTMKELIRKNIHDPYATNILRSSFDAGYNAANDSHMKNLNTLKQLLQDGKPQ